MTDRRDTVALLTEAITMAERHAGRLRRQGYSPSERQLKEGNREVQGAFFNEAAHRARIGDPASGPDHWQAVADTFRAAVKGHPADHHIPGECEQLQWTTCQWVLSLCPLAELVIQRTADASSS